MNTTPRMLCDDIVTSFNASAERRYWKAVIGGSRALPTVVFNSRTSMVQVTYYPQTNAYAISFSKVNCSFGDFTSSAYAALSAIHGALKASGHDIATPLDTGDGVLRLEYDPRTKQTHVALANLGDDWQEYSEVSFKVLPDVL